MKWMAHEAYGKPDRNGIIIMQLCDMFPTKESARKWLESGLRYPIRIAR